MDGEMADQGFATVEWTIENFTCWNSDVHGKTILQSDVDIEGNDFYLELHPKGIETLDDNLVVHVFDANRSNDFKLSIIDSKGSLLWNKNICNPTYKDDSTEIQTNISFKDVVENIVKDPKFKDAITLRYARKDLGDYLCLDQSKVDAFDRFLRIPSQILLDGYLVTKIIEFAYLIDGIYSAYYFSVLSIKSTDGGIECSFGLRADDHDALLQSYLYVLKSDDSNVVFKKNEYIIKGESINLCYFLPNGVIENACSLLIRLRIIYGKKYTNYELILCPKIFGSQNISHSSSENDSRRVIEDPKNGVSLLSEDLMCLYQDNKFSDFQLRCGDVTFPVHRGILSARSPVFDRMLSSDMREAASGSMDIEDLDPHTLGRFLAFLYSGDTGEVHLQWETALKLYYAADKYQVPSLKAECAAVLKDQVSVSNVCDILALSDKHQDKHLTSFVHDFISNNFNQVLQSEEWMCFMEKDPLLFGSTLTLLVKNKKLI